MQTRGDRLRLARKAHFDSIAKAAAALGMAPATLGSHERAQHPGGRDYGADEAERYGRRFRVPPEWLLTGRGPLPRVIQEKGKKLGVAFVDAEATSAADESGPRTVKLKGYVGAGATAHFYAVAQGDLDEVPAPDDATLDTVAVEIRGNSLGSLFDRWLVYYDEVHRPVTDNLNGKLCVVGLADERVLIKKIHKQANGRFRLLSEQEPPIEDAEIEWAARVKSMVPK